MINVSRRVVKLRSIIIVGSLSYQSVYRLCFSKHSLNHMSAMVKDLLQLPLNNEAVYQVSNPSKRQSVADFVENERAAIDLDKLVHVLPVCIRSFQFQRRSCVLPCSRCFRECVLGLRAISCACRRAQLSCTRWSLLIQYTTDPAPGRALFQYSSSLKIHDHTIIVHCRDGVTGVRMYPPVDTSRFLGGINQLK
jgi:hypothetical protein